MIKPKERKLDPKRVLREVDPKKKLKELEAKVDRCKRERDQLQNDLAELKDENRDLFLDIDALCKQNNLLEDACRTTLNALLPNRKERHNASVIIGKLQSALCAVKDWK